MSAAILKKWVCSSFSCCAKLVVASSSSTYKVFWTFKKTLPSSAYLCVKNKKNVGKSYVYIYLHLSRSKVHRTQWGEFHFDVAFKVIVSCANIDTIFFVGHFKTISGHFFAKYINIFHKTEIQTIILRCLTSLNFNWYKSYDTECKNTNFENVCFWTKSQ